MLKRRTINKHELGVALLLFLAIPGTGSAEFLYFAKGGQVQIGAEIQGQTVRLDTPDGPIEFQRSDFRKIVPGNWPERDWDAREREARKGNADARFQAAWWALENGLTPQAESMLRRVLEADRSHQPAGRMVAVLDRLKNIRKEPGLETFRGALGSDFEVARSDHFVLLHQHTEKEAAERLELLDRVERSFFLMMAARGIELRIPPRRLVSAWFGEQSDYLTFLKAHNAGAFLSTRGYFHPTYQAVVAFDARSTRQHKDGKENLAARRRDLDRLAKAIEQMPARSRLRIEFTGEPARTLGKPEAKEALQRLTRDVARMELIQDLDRRAIDVGTAAHELIHQLVAETGLAPNFDDFPRWLHEGFAAQFEVVRGGRWAGISRAHDLRLPDWRAIKGAPRLITRVQDHGAGRGYDRDVYAESWGLVYFLRQRHPDAFLTYVDKLRSPDHESARGPERNLKLFQAAFGDDLVKLETEWREFLDSVRTPLEEADSPVVPERER